MFSQLIRDSVSVGIGPVCEFPCILHNGKRDCNLLQSGRKTDNFCIERHPACICARTECFGGGETFVQEVVAHCCQERVESARECWALVDA